MTVQTFTRAGLLIIGDGEDLDEVQASEQWIATGEPMEAER